MCVCVCVDGQNKTGPGCCVTHIRIDNTRLFPLRQNYYHRVDESCGSHNQCYSLYYCPTLGSMKSDRGLYTALKLEIHF